MLKKISLLILFVLLSTTVITACGNKNETTLEKVQRTKEMTFAMTGAYPPFNFINEDGELQGFDIDIANALAEKLGAEAVPKTTLWDGIVAGLQGKRFDTIIGSMAITEEREEQVGFTEPYYIDGAQLFVTEDSTISGIEDIGDGTIGIVTGTTFQDFLINDMNIKESNIKQFESDVDNIKSLEMGRIDGLVTAKLVGMNGAKNYEASIKPAGEPLYEERCAIAVRKEDEDLLLALNKALQEIKEDGTYADISKKWFGSDISQ